MSVTLDLVPRECARQAVNRSDGTSEGMAMPKHLVFILACLCLPPCLDLSAGEGWETFRGDVFRNGNADGSAIPTSFAVKWSHGVERFNSPSLDSSCAVVGGSVFIGMAERSVFSSGGVILCVNAENGTAVWERKTRFPVFSSPAVAAGRVFVGEGYHQDSDCRLYCLDAKTGRDIWTFTAKSHVESSPHATAERVTFGAGEDGIYCLNAVDGKIVWHHPKEHVDISPLVSSGFVFAGTGYGKTAAICLSAKDGKEVWRTEVDVPVWGSPVRVGTRLYLGLGNGSLIQSDPDPKGAVVCLAASNGKKVWRRDLPDAVLTAVAFKKGTILAGCRDGKLYALKPSNGEIAWKCSLGGAAVVASPLVGENEVAAISDSGRLVVASIGSGEILGSFDLSRIVTEETVFISSPALWKGNIIVGSGNRLVCLQKKK